MNRSSLTIGVYFAAIFLCGVAVGGFAHRLYTANGVNAQVAAPRNPEEFRRAQMLEMTNRLQLDQSQVQQLGQIMDETRLQYRAFKDKHRPELKAIHDAQSERIRAILNPSQLPEYERLLIERERRMQEGGK
jgi:hypothetical protein